jgi:hypothetical protein
MNITDIQNLFKRIYEFPKLHNKLVREQGLKGIDIIGNEDHIYSITYYPTEGIIVTTADPHSGEGEYDYLTIPFEFVNSESTPEDYAEYLRTLNLKEIEKQAQAAKQAELKKLEQAKIRLLRAVKESERAKQAELKKLEQAKDRLNEALKESERLKKALEALEGY